MAEISFTMHEQGQTDPNEWEELFRLPSVPLNWEELMTLIPIPFPILVCFSEFMAIILLGPFFYALTPNGKGKVDIRHLNSGAAMAQAQANLAQAQAQVQSAGR